MVGLKVPQMAVSLSPPNSQSFALWYLSLLSLTVHASLSFFGTRCHVCQRQQCSSVDGALCNKGLQRSRARGCNCQAEEGQEPWRGWLLADVVSCITLQLHKVHLLCVAQLTMTSFYYVCCQLPNSQLDARIVCSLSYKQLDLCQCCPLWYSAYSAQNVSQTWTKQFWLQWCLQSCPKLGLLLCNLFPGSKIRYSCKDQEQGLLSIHRHILAGGRWMLRRSCSSVHTHPQLLEQTCLKTTVKHTVAQMGPPDTQ